MQEIIQILVGICVLVVGILTGDFLSRITKEELPFGQRWFKLIIALCLFGGILGLIIRNDILMFSLLFIAIVTSRSLR